MRARVIGLMPVLLIGCSSVSPGVPGLPGEPGSTDTGGDQPAPAPGQVTPAPAGPAGGTADGPIVARFEGGSFAYPIGRCEVIDDVVYVSALSENPGGSFEATLPAWDREIAYSQRQGRVSLTGTGSSAADSFQLAAGRNDAGTTWEWTVSGSDVQITARMGNEARAERQDGGSRLTEYRDVTIDIQCSGGVFGSGIWAQQYAEQEFHPIEPGLVRAPGSVTIDLEGTEYRITYLSLCQFFSEDVSAEGTANEAAVYLYSEGRGVQLDLLIGDRRAEEEGTRWSLPPEAELQSDFRFEGSDTSRTWSGSIVSADGLEAPATITVECAEGDAFVPSGTATVVLDGKTHVLDEVTTCSIEGTTVEFFGGESNDGIAVVVTGGGSQILFGDEEGRQTATFDVEFEVSGQQATWTGVLAGDRQATISISCG